MKDYNDFYKFFKNYNNYIGNITKEFLKAEYLDTYREYKKIKFKYIFNFTIRKFKRNYKNIETYVDNINEEYIKKQMILCKDLFSDINGYPLDEDQIRAILTDEESTLIAAGAGSGKTLTMIGKIRYLVEKKKIKPKEILCISFTNFTTESLKKAILKQTDYSIDVYTFHKLGCEIIKQNNIKIIIAEDKKLEKIIDSFLKEDVLYNKELSKILVEYFSYYINMPEFLQNSNSPSLKEENKKEIEEVLKYNKETLNGEFVKSNEELIIANFLYMNGINYKYEVPYPYDYLNFEYKKYQPDFYLIDYDIYLEHFGISKDNNVNWLSEIEGVKYLEGIEWKRQIHKKNKTKMLETYSYYFTEGSIFDELNNIIKENNIKVKLRNESEIYEKLIEKQYLSCFNDFKSLVATFINLFKANSCYQDNFSDIEQTINSEKNSFIRKRSLLFFKIVYSIYLKYEVSLKENKELDFNDMIEKATELVNKYGIKNKYKYIIIDEYQDTSKTRYKLIEAIIKKTGAKIVAVGDDFQSIYRFTGCDLKMFLDFQNIFKQSKILKIQNTYRNSQELIDIAGKFIMKNKKQLRKNLVSFKTSYKPVKIYYFSKNNEFELLLNEIESNEILILGRNNKDINFLKYNSNFVIHSNKEITYLKKEDLKIKFMTVHTSKGLESENVIIINLENKSNGFPNKIVNDIVLDYVIENKDNYPYEEERRLFYVALTRTKNNVYLFASKNNCSTFVEEIFNDNKNHIEIISDKYSCPDCGNILVERESKYGKFIGCKSYPKCKYKRSTIEYKK